MVTIRYYLKQHFNYKSRSVILLTLLILSSFSIISGQKIKEEPPPFRDRLFYGGNIGLQFGTITDIQLSPVIGFWLLPRLAVAAGPEYRFFKYRQDRTNIYGVKSYMEFVVIQNINSIVPIGVNTGIFLHLEDELLSLESSYWKNFTYSGRFYLNTVLAGGGISQQLGRRSSMNIMVLWALNDSSYDVYSNPEIRVSFIF